MYDWANSAFATTIMAAVLPVYYSSVAAANLQGNLATVYWAYTTSISLLIAALVSPILGALADFSGVKKRFLAIFAFIGVLGTALLYFVKTGDWLMASGFFVIGELGFAGSLVFYDSLLPHIASGEEMDQVSSKGYAHWLSWRRDSTGGQPGNDHAGAEGNDRTDDPAYFCHRGSLVVRFYNPTAKICTRASPPGYAR